MLVFCLRLYKFDEISFVSKVSLSFFYLVLDFSNGLIYETRLSVNDNLYTYIFFLILTLISVVMRTERFMKSSSLCLTRTVSGLFEDSHMRFHLDANASVQPTLAEMTKKAIEVLRKEKKGYFLFVEGGLIDAAHHRVMAKIAMDETVEFSKAVQQAVDMTSESDTLIVVTSDHSHTMTMAGYPVRGNDISGLVGDLGDDNLPFSTLSYANGPRVKEEKEGCARKDLSNTDMSECGTVMYTSVLLLSVGKYTINRRFPKCLEYCIRNIRVSELPNIHRSKRRFV